MKGKVYLVGAGPGDPGLLTVKAARLLSEADLIVYDYLANPAHLKHAKPGARAIGVGRGFRHKRLSQDRINRLITDAAKKGKTVVRLKGGDPYFFGRGGEEALYLKEHGIPFETVPGVTSATAASAYAGIPLTHRDHNASVTFLTGHRADDEGLDTVAWDKIVQVGGTVVIYMGFYNLALIAERLIRSGKPADTPVAVIEWGTLPRQRSVAGTLDTIAADVAKRGFTAPCLIVVGEVVGLRASLNWFESLPLFGKKIVLTRNTDDRSALRDRLEALGAEVLLFPVIEIRKAPAAAIDRMLKGLKNFDWVVFSSVNGVRAFFERFEGDVRSLAHLKVASVGPATAEELRRWGLKPDLQPAKFETREIVAEFKKRFKTLKGKRVLLFRADLASEELNRGLEALGASVKQVTAYKTVSPRAVPADVRARLKRGVDAVTFTSASTVRHFVKLVGRAEASKLSRRAKFFSIGPVTTAEMRRAGLKPAAEAEKYTFGGLVDAVKETL